MYRRPKVLAMLLLRTLRVLTELDPILVQMAVPGCASWEWLRAHPREASAAGYVLVGSKATICPACMRYVGSHALIDCGPWDQILCGVAPCGIPLPYSLYLPALH
jgi:hypothetical protein